MDDFVRYLDEIVDPTVADFEAKPASVRHAFLTCVAVFHAIDYLAYPNPSRGLRNQYKAKSRAFALVDRVAHAFKHVETNPRQPTNLIASSVIARPPAVMGVMEYGLSITGDIAGAVTLKEDPSISVLDAVKEAVKFLKEQTRVEINSSKRSRRAVNRAMRASGESLS